MFYAALPFLFALVGLLMYVLASNTKVSELGRILFFAGMLATLLPLGGHLVRLIP